MTDNVKKNKLFTNSAPRPIQSCSRNVRGCIVGLPLTMQLILRALIGQHRSHDHFSGLSLGFWIDRLVPQDKKYLSL